VKSGPGTVQGLQGGPCRRGSGARGCTGTGIVEGGTVMLAIVTVLFLCAAVAAAGVIAICREGR